MAEKVGAAVNARIVYWGVPGAGVSTTLRRLFTKLRPDHRGELQEVPTRLDPTVTYEVLPIKLGLVGGVDTRMEIVAVPGGEEHAPTRKQLLDRADGVVFVLDARRERLGESVASFEELRQTFAAYGRRLETLPLVIQANHRGAPEPGVVDEFTRKLDLPRVPRFETVAAEGSGVLQALSTISKAVVRSLRDQPSRAQAATGAASGAPTSAPAPVVPAAVVPAAPVVPAARVAPAAAAAPRTPPVAPAAPPPAAPPPPAFAPRERSGAGEEWPAPLRPRRPAAVAASPRATHPAEELTGRLEPRPPAPTASLRVVAVGHASCDDQRTVQLPLELQDGEGHRFRVTLSLAIGPLLTGGD